MIIDHSNDQHAGDHIAAETAENKELMPLSVPQSRMRSAKISA